MVGGGGWGEGGGGWGEGGGGGGWGWGGGGGGGEGGGGWGGGGGGWGGEGGIPDVGSSGWAAAKKRCGWGLWVAGVQMGLGGCGRVEGGGAAGLEVGRTFAEESGA